MPSLSILILLPFWSASVSDFSSSLSTIELPAGVASVITILSSSKCSFIPERLLYIFSWLSSLPVSGAALALLCSMPRIIGWRGSASRKPTVTSSPISGRKKKPRSSPASRLATRAHRPSPVSPSSGRRTRTRCSLSGSSLLVTMPICRPDTAGSRPPAASALTGRGAARSTPPNWTCVFQPWTRLNSWRTPVTSTLPLKRRPNPASSTTTPGRRLAIPSHLPRPETWSTRR